MVDPRGRVVNAREQIPTAELISDYKCLRPSGKVSAKENTPANSLKHKSPPGEQQAKEARFPQSNIFSLPRTKTAMTRGTSARRLEAMFCIEKFTLERN
jgi:hypothetical protein